jgi:hypothetical protein
VDEDGFSPSGKKYIHLGEIWLCLKIGYPLGLLKIHWLIIICPYLPYHLMASLAIAHVSDTPQVVPYQGPNIQDDYIHRIFFRVFEQPQKAPSEGLQIGHIYWHFAYQCLFLVNVLYTSDVRWQVHHSCS